MSELFWNKIKNLAEQKATLHTKTKVPFQVIAATEKMIKVRVRSGEVHTISRVNLEKAVAKIQAGVVLSGPKEYRDQVADDRPAYAWAILYALEYFQH
jgi:hypothetical protein